MPPLHGMPEAVDGRCSDAAWKGAARAPTGHRSIAAQAPGARAHRPSAT